MANYVAWGFDYSFGNGLTIAELKASGCKFVCRYLSGTPGSGKDISALEILNYYNADIDLVFNWETWGVELSKSQGISHAQAAQAELNKLADELVALKAPANLVSAVKVTPVTFSLDKDPRPQGVLPGAEDYQRGVVSVIGLARSGAYGGEEWIKTAFDMHLITYGWQTYAWSGGQWDPRAQLQQWNNGYVVGPAQVDQDRATVADFGQCKWHIAPPKPPPPPAPKPQRHVADGTMSLDQFLAKNRLSMVLTLETSAQKLLWWNLKALVMYLAKGPASKMPKGLVFWTIS